MTPQAPQEAPKYDILSPVFFADPYPTLQRMQDEDPVYWHPLLHAWVLTRYDDVLRVIRDPAGFSARRVEQYGVGAPEHVQQQLAAYNAFLQTWVAFMDPPQHTRQRAIVAKAFTVQAVDRLRPRIERQTDELLAPLVARGEADLLADFAGPLPLVVLGELLGVPTGDAARLKQDVDRVVHLLGVGVATADAVEIGHQGVVALKEYFGRHIAEKRARPTEDLLSGLIEARVDGTGLDDEELTGMAAMLFLAGHDTTTHTIGNAVHVLLRHPEAMQALRQDPGLIDAACEELMRFDGPTVATFRRTLTAQDFGVEIPAGAFVLAHIGAANRDRRRFADPDRLELARPDAQRHLVFSNGVHTCPGAALARLELRIALRALLRTFSDIRLAGAPEWVPHMMVRGVKALPVTLMPA